MDSLSLVGRAAQLDSQDVAARRAAMSELERASLASPPIVVIDDDRTGRLRTRRVDLAAFIARSQRIALEKPRGRLATVNFHVVANAYKWRAYSEAAVVASLLLAGRMFTFAWAFEIAANGASRTKTARVISPDLAIMFDGRYGRTRKEAAREAFWAWVRELALAQAR